MNEKVNTRKVLEDLLKLSDRSLDSLLPCIISVDRQNRVSYHVGGIKISEGNRLYNRFKGIFEGK